MEIKIRDLMIKKLVTAEENSSIQNIARKMKKVGSVLIKKKGKIYGIITDSDIIKKVVAKGLDPKKVKAKEIVSTPLLTIKADENVQKASYLMKKYRIKRLVVVDNSKIVGIISATDIAKYIPDYLDILLLRREIAGKIKKSELEELETETIGICEECGNIGTLTLVEGRWLCEFCTNSNR